MDNFTALANKILTEQRDIKVDQIGKLLKKGFEEPKSYIERPEIEDQENGIRSLDGFFSDEEAHIEDNENDMDQEVKKIVNTLELAGKFGSPEDTGKLKRAKKQITDTAASGLKKLDSVLKTNLDKI